MTCEELRALLEFEGAATGDAAREHLRTCQACATEVQRWQAVQAELHDMGQEPAPPFLHSRIMAHVRAEAPTPYARAGLRSWRAPALAAFGAAVVVLGLGLFRAISPPATTPAGERVRIAEKQGVPAPADPPDRGGARAPAAAVPAPASVSATRSEKIDDEQQVDRRTVSAAEDDLAFAAKTEAGRTQSHPSETEARQSSGDGVAPSVVAQAAPAKEGVSQLEVAAPAVARTGSEVPMVGTLQTMERKKEAVRVVRCRLQLEDGAEELDLDLQVAQAPPPHEVWSVMVAPDGRLEVLDARGRTQPVPVELQQRLSRQQQLRLGRYRLSQAPARSASTQ
ncbi:MAG TPA: hypothetical protein PLP31_01195 [Thermoanaerobaculaceae bacterium]|nr:hypothetical protein [Thermoanaerobaculaceae bacterium]